MNPFYMNREVEELRVYMNHLPPKSTKTKQIKNHKTQHHSFILISAAHIFGARDNTAK